ncbi:hypothetical protein [Oricola cellulosilytica]|uniref:Glycoside hydrolase family 104 protein n=2 Tax=Oricola cellulosilytica TaxID=1429082 RepID=A0A4R0PCF0_9HYPH|nr:hypothetical protein [Oricola cellulosilytica]TCD15140.1 hypothetical protein E0D97_06215 [Oricola cellulosilytica]
MTKDPRHVYRPMLNLIGLAEGTDPYPPNPPHARGYNETLAYGAYTGGPVELVSMTLDEVDALQTRMLRHPRNEQNSSAAGRYQIVRTTLRSIRNTLKLSGNAVFDAAMQDRLACFLLGARGIDRWLAGRMGRDALINALAKEWASLPRANGKGHYSDQKARVTVDQMRQALDATRQRHGAATRPPAAPDPEPDLPAAPPAPSPGETEIIAAARHLAALPDAEFSRLAAALAVATALRAGYAVTGPGAAPLLPNLQQEGKTAMFETPQSPFPPAPPPAAKPWWQSKGVLGGIGAIGALLGPAIGLDLGQTNINDTAVAVNDLLAAAAALVAIWGRVTAKTRIG